VIVWRVCDARKMSSLTRVLGNELVNAYPYAAIRCEGKPFTSLTPDKMHNEGFTTASLSRTSFE